MQKLKIRISNNEYVTKDVPSGEKMKSEYLYTSKSQRRKHITRETKAIPDLHATMILHMPKIKELGYVNSQDIIYRIVPKTQKEYRLVQVAVPKRGRHYIDGALLKKWIAKMDSLHPRGWEPVPKFAIEEDVLSITDIIAEQGPMSLDQLKEFVEVADFEEEEEKDEDKDPEDDTDSDDDGDDFE